jgi:hypothetical protein
MKISNHRFSSTKFDKYQLDIKLVNSADSSVKICHTSHL